MNTDLLLGIITLVIVGAPIILSFVAAHKKRNHKVSVWEV